MSSIRHSIRCVAVAGLLALAAGLSLALALDAAQAAEGAASTSSSAALPPITTFPAAGVTAPPADAISDPRRPEAGCGGWYAQNSYFGGQPTGSTWWEYACRYEWPVLFDGSQTNADWSGYYVQIDYFHWDGAKPVFSGESFFDGYSDSWFSASYCYYWWDEPTNQWYGPYDLSAPGQCSG